jgi:hypothetical protein
MIQILAMLLLLLIASGVCAEAKDCHRKALAMHPQAGLAQAGRQRVTNHEK